MINIVLVEPEIPQNTGNIARTCACTNSRLHLVGKLGFDISEKSVRRAGLDYWDKLSISHYQSLDEFMDKNKNERMYFCSTKAKRIYSEADYSDKEVFLVFGKETKGLPEELIFTNFDKAIKIPMTQNIRSLNLSNAVAIVLYEALRQRGFGF